MKIKNTYPSVEKRKIQRRKVLSIVRWPFISAAVACTTVNLLVGGKPWFLIVLGALYMIWTTLLSPDLVEYNRTSQFIKMTVYICILLFLIEHYLAPGWALPVLPLVCCCGLTVTAILFLCDLDRQKQNMLPMLLLTLAAIGASGTSLCLMGKSCPWPLTVMGALALAWLITFIALLRGDFLRELKKRFHVQ